MAYRVIQWATGGVGRASIEGILSHPELELVGCWVHTTEKVGKDAGELCGMAALGVVATNDIEELLALEADCVMYSPIMPDREIVRRILESGKNVVTPLGWFYPETKDVTDLEEACHVRSEHIVAFAAIFLGGLSDVLVDVAHDSLEFLIHFLA